MKNVVNCAFAEKEKVFLLISILTLSMAVNAGIDVPVPSTDFSSGYTFLAENALQDGNIELQENGEYYLRYFDRKDNGTAAWLVSVTKPCLVSVTLNMFDNSWNNAVDASYKNGGHIFKVRIIDNSETPKDSVEEASESSSIGNIPLSGTLYFEKAGIYMVELLNSRQYSKCGIAGITLTAESIPETSFASPYSFEADDATLHGADAQFLLETSVTPHYIRYADHSQPGPVVTWKINATRACFVNVTLNFADNSSFYSGNKHIMDVLLCNGYGNEIDSIAEGPAFDGDGFTENGVDKTLAGTIKIPAAGIYIIKMLNNRNHSKTGIYGVTLSYAGGAVQNMPGTTDISESGYSGGTRADGKFTIASGKQDKAWMEWNVAFANSGNYNVYLKVNSSNGKKFKIALQDANKNDVVTPLEKNGGDNGSPVTLEMGSMYVPAGNYTLKLTNNEAWSNAEWISIQFVYAGGAVTDIPATLQPVDAIRSEYAYINEAGEFRFTDDGNDGHVTTQWGKWNIHVTKAGLYTFTFNAKSDNSHHYKLYVLNTDETQVAEYTLDGSYGEELTTTTAKLQLAASDYIIKVTNTTNNSHGRVVKIIADYVGGATIDIPANTLTAQDAVLVASANKLRRVDGTLVSRNTNTTNADYAWWKVRATQTGTVNVNLTILSGTDKGHSYIVGLYTDLEQAPVQEVNEDAGGSWQNGEITLGTFNVTEDNTYYVKVLNPLNWSEAILGGVRLSYPIPVIEDEEEDENEVLVPYEGKTGDVQITRTLVGGMYNTICLPFAVSAAEKARVFGSAKVKELTDSSIESDGFVLNLNFTEVNEMAAGVPYLIKPAANIENPTFLGVTIDNMLNDSETDVADFIGNFVVSEVPAGRNNYFLSADNKLYYSNSATAINGMRGYFALKNISGNAPTRARIIEAENVATEIDIVNGEMPETFTNTGKLIENGQLILVRDGIRYNALGVKIK